MAYTLTIPIALEPSDVGLTLSAQLRDTAGDAVGGAVTSGFIEAGLGMYYWTYASFPDGHRGVVEFSSGGILQTIYGINPEEAENLPVKQTGDSFARLGAPAGASIAADLAAIEAQTDDIGAAGAGLTAVPWNAAWDAEVQSEAADALSAYDPPTKAELDSGLDALPTAAENASQVRTELTTELARVDVAVSSRLATAGYTVPPTVAQILTTAMTEAYAADGVAPTLAQALFLIMQRLTEFGISGTVVTIKKLDGSTTAATLTLDDASAPTSSTRAS